MTKITPLKLFIFLFVILPLALLVFAVLIIPLMIVLAILSLFWSGKIFHFRSFRHGGSSSNSSWQEMDPSGKEEDEDFVDVESTVVESTVTDKEEKKQTVLIGEHKE